MPPLDAGGEPQGLVPDPGGSLAARTVMGRVWPFLRDTETLMPRLVPAPPSSPVPADTVKVGGGVKLLTWSSRYGRPSGALPVRQSRVPAYTRAWITCSGLASG